MSLKTVGNKKLWQTEIEVNMTKPFFKGLEGMVVKLDETRQQSCLSHCLVDLQLLESVFLSWFTSSNDLRAIKSRPLMIVMIHDPNPGLLFSLHCFPP